MRLTIVIGTRYFFMYDIEWNNDKFFLVINITDYGKTITGNVQEYQKSVHKNI